MTVASLAAAGLLLAMPTVSHAQNAVQHNPLTSAATSEQPRVPFAGQPSGTGSQMPNTETGQPGLEPQPQPEARGVAPCPNRKARACVDLSSNRTWLLRDGKVVYGPVPITHGREGFRTPVGTFRVQFKSKYHRSSLFNFAPMPNAVFFHRGVAFHQGNLRNLSHGCIRLSAAASQMYFATLKIGDVVQVVR
ncbi:L,D-transpeptidase [Allokutzneria oryzae]|uniref:L,D-transpeptidase n=1 Tax=Allokutzneria oryzae TaxID=1378989 RepID=A0ABV6AB52_9PSEU